MERIIEDLEKELRDIIEGKPLKHKRQELGDDINFRFCQIMTFALLWASVGYQSALRLAGMKLGKSIGAKCEKAELGLVLEEIKKIIEALKAGRAEIKILPAEKGVQFIVFEGAISWGVPNVLQNLCFFQEGFIEGYLDGVISKLGPLVIAGSEGVVSKVNVIERRCVGLGDEYCEFLIQF